MGARPQLVHFKGAASRVSDGHGRKEVDHEVRNEVQQPGPEQTARLEHALGCHPAKKYIQWRTKQAAGSASVVVQAGEQYRRHHHGLPGFHPGLQAGQQHRAELEFLCQPIDRGGDEAGREEDQGLREFANIRSNQHPERDREDSDKYQYELPEQLGPGHRLFDTEYAASLSRRI